MARSLFHPNPAAYSAGLLSNSWIRVKNKKGRSSAQAFWVDLSRVNSIYHFSLQLLFTLGILLMPGAGSEALKKESTRLLDYNQWLYDIEAANRIINNVQEPGSVHLATLKESTQAWLNDRKIKGFYTGLFVSFYVDWINISSAQWRKATASKRGPSPAWPWLAWASSPPTWCSSGSRRTGWPTSWLLSSTSVCFKERLISTWLWEYWGSGKPQTLWHLQIFPQSEERVGFFGAF